MFVSFLRHKIEIKLRLVCAYVKDLFYNDYRQDFRESFGRNHFLPAHSRCLILQLNIPPSRAALPWFRVVIPSFLPHQKTKAQLFCQLSQNTLQWLIYNRGTCSNIICFQQNQYSDCKHCNLSIYYLSSSLPQLP